MVKISREIVWEIFVGRFLGEFLFDGFGRLFWDLGFGLLMGLSWDYHGILRDGVAYEAMRSVGVGYGY